MGFKDAAWAYTLDLPMAQKVVLVAICHRTDDKTHTTLVGQETVAAMVGMSVRSVNRAVGVLDSLGILTREPRRRSDGYRSSDATTINLTYAPESHVTDDHATEGHVTESPISHDTVSDLTRPSVMAIDVIQIDQSEDQPDNTAIALIPPMAFERFWEVWPRKDGRKAALTAWNAAIRRASPELIVERAAAYAQHPHRPPKQYVPHGATWLRGDRWTDPLPEAPEAEHSKPSPTDRARAILALVPEPLKEIS